MNAREEMPLWEGVVPSAPQGDDDERRPTREMVEEVLALDGREVELAWVEWSEDVDGFPIATPRRGRVTVSADGVERFGWSAAEWADPGVTE